MKARLIFLSCYLPRLLDHFRPVGPWAELLKTVVVNPWSKPRWAEKKDGLSRNGVISSLESNLGCCQAPSPAPYRLSPFLPLWFFCYVSVFPFLSFQPAFSGNWVSVHQRTFCILALSDIPLFIQMFLYVCAWACHEAGQSCCGIFLSLPGPAFAPLGLTKAVHCLLIITGTEGSPALGRWVGGRGRPREG